MFYLTPEEQLEGEQEIFNQEKHIRNKKAIVTAEQYENCSFILHSVYTIADYEQCQESQIERQPAIQPASKESNVKATVHFDSTRHSSVDGDWPPLITIFSNG